MLAPARTCDLVSRLGPLPMHTAISFLVTLHTGSNFLMRYWNRYTGTP